MSSVKAHAKVNLSLRVLGKRDDGYHDIDSVFSLIDLCDTIEIEAEAAGRFSCNLDSSDLMYKAAELWCRETDIPVSVVISIKKEIPVAAGLGGGSADAAAVLNYLDRKFGKSAAAAIAPRIGSDVPFFVTGLSKAHVTGRGERVEKLDKLESDLFNICNITLVIPPFKVNTKDAFALLDKQGESCFEAIEPNRSFGAMLRHMFPFADWRLSGSGGVWFTSDELDWTNTTLEFIFAKCI